MAKVIYGMSQYLVNKFAETKDYILEARKAFTNIKDLEAAKADVLKNAQINDTPYVIERNPGGKLYESRNGIAYIPIAGMLVQEVDICSVWFGETVTTYRYIREATIAADNDPDIKQIAYQVDSGGGYVNGVDMTAQTIAETKKPTTAIIHELSASAAYWVTSQADKVVALSRTAEIGSIGVAVEWINRAGQDKASGIKREVLTSTPATKKRPDLTKDEGKAVIIKELDDIHNVFVGAIMEGRPHLTEEKINGTAGGVLIAANAKDLGLIDDVIKESELESYILKTPAVAGKATVQVAKNKTEVIMNLKTLLETDPAAKAEYLNEQKALSDKNFKAGVESRQAEIDKVVPFLTTAYEDSRESAIDVLKGEAKSETFIMCVKMIDKKKESQKSDDAKKETADTGSTNTQGQSGDYEATIAADKKAIRGK